MASFRDRLLTPAGARALTAPSAIVLAGLGMSVGIVAGLPVAAAAAIGAAAWAGRVALGLPRAPTQPRIEPRRLTGPWAAFVRDALDSQVRFRRAITNASTGAIRDRLTDIGRRVDDGVEECWRIASHGHALDEALRNLDPPDEIRARLGQLGPVSPGSTNERVAQSLRAQLQSTERIAAVAADARERLRILDARLDEAVARAIELSLRAGEAVELGGLDSDVDALVADMEALRQALDETSGAARAV
jgi:hypothetical protein